MNNQQQQQQPTMEQSIELAKEGWGRFHRDADLYKSALVAARPVRIVGIHGKAGSGKSTLCGIIAQILEVQDTETISFAGPLKKIALSLGWTGDKDENGRRLLQTLGTECARDCIDVDIWLKHWVHAVFNARDKDLVFTDDMRFPNEVDLVQSCGGVTVKIIGRDEIASGADHASEKQSADEVFDYVLNNAGTVEEFRNNVVTMLKDLEWLI